jgi:prophage maintenance system killer protein
MFSQVSSSGSSSVSYQQARRASCTQIVFKVLKLALFTLLSKSELSQANPTVHEISTSQLPCLPECTMQAHTVLNNFSSFREYKTKTPIPAPEDCQRGANTLAGIILSKDGTSGFDFSKPIPRESFPHEMRRRNKLLKQFVENIPYNPRFRADFERQIANPMSRGTRYSIDEENDILYFGISPLQRQNECRAYKKTKKWVSKISSLSSEQIEEKILKTHETLMRKINPSYAGKYRREKLIIHETRPNQPQAPTDSAATYEYWIQSIKLNSATQAEEEENLRILQQMTVTVEGLTTIKRPASSEQQKLADLVGASFTTPSDQIKSEMSQFAKNLRQAYQRRNCFDFNPIEFAAYVHQTLIAIHPFEDWNGHCARLLLKVFLEEFGYKLIVRDPIEYQVSVRLDLKQPGIFADYIRQAIEWTQEYFTAEFEADLRSFS